MLDGPRNWKWMVPAMLLPMVILLGYWMSTVEEQGWLWVRLAALVPFTWAFVLLLSAVKNFNAYFGQQEAETFMLRQQAAAISPVTELADSLKLLHPAYHKIINMHTQTVWMIKEGTQPDSIVDYILFGTRIPIHTRFVAHILTNSSAYSVMSKRQLADKSKKWDPDGMYTDYELYDELLAYWKGQGRVTNGYGNNSAQWVYPWEPRSIAEAMDLDLFDEADEQEGKQG